MVPKNSNRFMAIWTGALNFYLSRVPKGYEPDNPAAEYLKLKSYIAMVSLKDTDLTSKDLVKKTAANFEALQPLINFVNKSMV